MDQLTIGAAEAKARGVDTGLVPRTPMQCLIFPVLNSDRYHSRATQTGHWTEVASLVAIRYQWGCPDVTGRRSKYALKVSIAGQLRGRVCSSNELKKCPRYSAGNLLGVAHNIS
jgi:hypothetical protein